MFWPDVIELKEFYTSTLGQVACRVIRRCLHRFWPEGAGDTVLGIGFTPPFLLPYLEGENLVMACMPASQGVIHWPNQHPNLTFLSDEAQLPIGDNMVNRVLLVHAMENSEQVRQMLQEIWRVLAPSGRLIAVVPNRGGVWARAAGSPFAYGRPFTSSQLRSLLTETSFTPTRSENALFLPPTKRQFLLRSATLIEEFGSRLCSAFGGLIVMEAEKRLYAPSQGVASPSRAKRDYVPAAKPAMTFRCD